MFDQSHVVQGSAVYLEEGGFQGGLCLLMLLQEMPSLASTAHWDTCAPNNDGAALVEGSILLLARNMQNVVETSPGKVWGNILYTDEAGSPSFS